MDCNCGRHSLDADPLSTHLSHLLGAPLPEKAHLGALGILVGHNIIGHDIINGHVMKGENAPSNTVKVGNVGTSVHLRVKSLVSAGQDTYNGRMPRKC